MVQKLRGKIKTLSEEEPSPPTSEPPCATTAARLLVEDASTRTYTLIFAVTNSRCETAVGLSCRLDADICAHLAV